MKREDYVKKATARIFDDRQKRAVSAELEDHIAHRTAALEEIGYNGYITIEQERDPRNSDTSLRDVKASVNYLKRVGYEI